MSKPSRRQNSPLANSAAKQSEKSPVGLGLRSQSPAPALKEKKEDVKATPFNAESGLLQTLQSHIDELRNLTTCKICIRSLYEPYTLSCGHTFCYGCLTQWFNANKWKKTCPDCRSDITRQPAPAYLVKELTQMFVTRPELLGINETTDEHKRLQQEESDTINRDKQDKHPISGGLFKGHFGGYARVRFAPTRHLLHHLHRLRHVSPPHLTDAPPIRDTQDGVERCPNCAWEIEDGECGNCGYLTRPARGLNAVDYCPNCTFELEDGECAHCGFVVEDTTETGFSEMEDMDPMVDLEDLEDMEDDMEDDDFDSIVNHRLIRPSAGYDGASNPDSDDTDVARGQTADLMSDVDEDNDSEDAGSLENFIDDDEIRPSSPASTATVHRDYPTDEEIPTESEDIVPAARRVRTARRPMRRIGDSSDSGDADSPMMDDEVESDRDVAVQERSSSSEPRSNSAVGTSFEAPIDIESSEDEAPIRTGPLRRRRQQRATTGLSFDDFETPLRSAADSVRAVANAWRSPSRASASRGGHQRSARSQTPSARNHGRISRDRTQSRNTSAVGIESSHFEHRLVRYLETQRTNGTMSMPTIETTGLHDEDADVAADDDDSVSENRMGSHQSLFQRLRTAYFVASGRNQSSVSSAPIHNSNHASERLRRPGSLTEAAPMPPIISGFDVSRTPLNDGDTGSNLPSFSAVLAPSSGPK